VQAQQIGSWKSDQAISANAKASMTGDSLLPAIKDYFHFFLTLSNRRHFLLHRRKSVDNRDFDSHNPFCCVAQKQPRAQDIIAAPLALPSSF
jgi:hypothetical protein